MNPWQEVLHDVDTAERLLGRKRFIKRAAMMVGTPRISLEVDDREFLRRMAAALIRAKPMRSGRRTLRPNGKARRR
jgi:hypothetical protein